MVPPEFGEMRRVDPSASSRLWPHPRDFLMRAAGALVEKFRRKPRNFRTPLLLRGLEHPGCPICRDYVGEEDKFFFWYFAESYFERQNLDQVTHALGFCRSHGAYIVRADGARSQIAFLHAFAARRIRARLLDMLGNRKAAAKALTFFSTVASCQACKSRDNHMERSLYFLSLELDADAIVHRYGKPGFLCTPHLLQLLPELPDALFVKILDVQMAAVSDAIDEAKANQRELPRERTDALLELAVGHDVSRREFPDWHEAKSISAAASGPVQRVSQNLRRDHRCPICLEVRGAWIEWMQWLEGAVENEAIIADVLPTCPDHVWAAVRQGSPRLAAAITAQALAHAAVPLTYGVNALRTPLDAGEKRLRRHLLRLLDTTGRRVAVARERTQLGGSQCPLCRRLELTRDRALELLHILLMEQRHRSNYEKGFGLCLKHLQRALTMFPRSAQREFAITAQIAKLDCLVWELQECQRKNAWQARPETLGDEMGSPDRAIMRFSGSLDA
jgi:hypothetical protein